MEFIFHTVALHEPDLELIENMVKYFLIKQIVYLMKMPSIQFLYHIYTS